MQGAEGWYEFVSGCPGDGCGNMKLDIRWKHSKCGGHEEINSEADIKCLKCGVVDCVMNWRFACRDHSDEFRKPEIAKLTWALSVALVVAKNKGDKVWASRFQKKLLKLQDELGYDE